MSCRSVGWLGAILALTLVLFACPGRGGRAVPTEVDLDWPDAAPPPHLEPEMMPDAAPTAADGSFAEADAGAADAAL